MGNKKIYLFHVGIDSTLDPEYPEESIGVSGPIFLYPGEMWRKFEYIPIDEGDIDYRKTSFVKTYEEIPSRNYPNRSLAEFIPNHPVNYRENKTHLDPSFGRCTGSTHFTYSEPIWDKDFKWKKLLELVVGDYIVFYSSLAPYKHSVYSQKPLKKNSLRKYQNNNKEKYIIGIFKISGVAKVEKYKRYIKPKIIVDEDKRGYITQNAVNENAHSKRDEDYFVVAIGNKDESVLLDKAIPISSGIIKKRKKKGKKRAGYTYKVNRLGKKILGSETDSLRGFREAQKSNSEQIIDTIKKRGF